MGTWRGFEFLRWRSRVELRSTEQPGAAVPTQTRWRRVAALMLAAGLSASQPAVGQETAKRPDVPSEDAASRNSLSDAVRALGEQVRELQASMAAMRSESQQARAETQELRREIEELRSAGSEQKPAVLEAVVRTNVSPSSGISSKSGDSIGQSAALQDNDQDEQKKASHAASLEEQYELLSGKVDDQYQTKVESASKYRMRISGLVLMNTFSNQGYVDNIDLPALALARPAGDSGGSFGATLRQSELGFEVFGPRVAGARTRADLQLDLAGGFASIPNGIDSGLVRLRTATMRMDWENTSLVVGQDGLFFSPSSPTSFATLAEPALSYAGNLWSWVPQIRVEHRVALGEKSSLLFQGGILDPVSGEVPGTGPYRAAGPGEESRQPAYGTRVAWMHEVSGQPLRLGVGGFYSRQAYGFGQTVDAWAAMSDLEIPLGAQLSLSGKVYRGKGLGGLYGGIGQSVLFSGTPGSQYTESIGVNSVGGWAQLKYRPTTKLELNAAVGIDNPYAADLEYFPYAQSYAGEPVARNHAGFVNFIYRPRSDLLFSAEYRRIMTDSLFNGSASAGHLNLMMGVLF